MRRNGGNIKSTDNSVVIEKKKLETLDVAILRNMAKLIIDGIQRNEKTVSEKTVSEKTGTRRTSRSVESRIRNIHKQYNVRGETSDWDKRKCIAFILQFKPVATS